MSSAINALLSESDDDEDEDVLNDATQLLEEDESSKPTGERSFASKYLKNL